MCFFKVKAPSIDTSVPASALVPQTDAKEPESPELGGTKDPFNKRRGRQQLTIARNSMFRPTNM